MEIRMNKDQEKFEKDTRKVFDNLHRQQAKDESIFNRLVALLSTDYFQVPKNFFKGKVCLDAGCGSNANATLAMLKMGAEFVHAFDLDESVFAARDRLEKESFSNFELSICNVLDIQYPDNFFDFTHCSGVLHHSASIAKGLSELARVTKPGGKLYIDVHGKYGITRDIMDVLRNKYAADWEFKAFIDNLDAKYLHDMWDWIVDTMAQHGDDLGTKITKEFMYQMLNQDLVLTIQDRIQAPAYHQSTEQEMRDKFEELGFTDIRRISRYPKQNNIRRFLCPFYFNYAHKYSRLFYGEGEPQLIATKR
jgi:ubiquinone/menaquinone biosynthesis C-methylase UbiE